MAGSLGDWGKDKKRFAFVKNQDEKAWNHIKRQRGLRAFLKRDRHIKMGSVK